jgi:hypothetical protein
VITVFSCGGSSILRFTIIMGWHVHRKAEINAALKQDMLNRGMSADDIRMVLDTGTPQSGKGCSTGQSPSLSTLENPSRKLLGRLHRFAPYCVIRWVSDDGHGLVGIECRQPPPAIQRDVVLVPCTIFNSSDHPRSSCRLLKTPTLLLPKNGRTALSVLKERPVKRY